MQSRLILIGWAALLILFCFVVGLVYDKLWILIL